jgi:hypothetical protein
MTNASYLDPKVDGSYISMAWYPQLALRGNLGKVFLCRGPKTKNGLRHEEELDWLSCFLGHYFNFPYCISRLWSTSIEVDATLFSFLGVVM